ncbi:thiamine phosphate synthase [Plantactinospora solaniradicis]|uniref:Thiamine phosphate synthase n=1 Tax=Plantactinospora solaniradicis TaxID=1723736 RepID=A0ABW1KFQ6_9ACTN
MRAGRGDVPDGIVLVTDRRQAARPIDELVRAAVGGGVRWVLLRERDLPRDERLDLAGRLRAILAEVDGALIVAGPDPLGGDAVHLTAAGPYPPPELGLVGRSCHDPSELTRLTTEDYVTISPVFPTPSKPGYGPPLRPAGLARLVARTRVPVLALGGVGTAQHVEACVAAGAAGVAVMGAVMRAEDPGKLVRDLCAAVGTEASPAASPVSPAPPAPAAPPAASPVSPASPAGRWTR